MPQPVPRQRSLDNVSAGAGNVSPNDATVLPITRPRPAPRKDVQSCIIETGNQPPAAGLVSPSPPVKRPGSVMVFPSHIPSAGQAVTSRTAPPPPATRPAPPPSGPKHPTTPPASGGVPLPPARPSRPLDKAAQKSPDPFDTSAFTSAASQPDHHILDRENSLVEGVHSESDPFDTSFAKFPPVLAKTPTGSSDPFDTSNVTGVNKLNMTSDQAQKPLSDPFNTDFVAQASLTSPYALNDEFHSSSLAKDPSPAASDMFVADPARCDVSLSGHRSSGLGHFGEGGFDVPNMSPPPLPSDMEPPSLSPPHVKLTSPVEAAPPPPKINPSGPPVPSRPEGVPPPVPRRPV